jgi:hypothetical protein
MLKLIIRTLPLAVLIALSWQGCKKSDLENTQLADHSAEFAFPLFNTSLEVNDLVSNILEENAEGDTLIINPDNTITLSYSGDVTEKKATDIFDFLSAPGLPVDSSYVQLSLMGVDGVSLRKADLSGGTMSVIMANTLSEKIVGTFYFPSMVNAAGVPYSVPFSINPGGTFFSFPTNLDGWSLNADVNIITLRYDAYLPDGTQVLRIPPNGSTPSAGVLFQNLTFHYMEGYWGKLDFPLSTDTIEIDINQTNLNGNVKVKNPKVTITVFNSYGFPTRGIIKYLRFRSKTGELIELESPLIQTGTETGIDFDYPSYAENEIGQTKTTTFYFDETNSNIAEVFNSQPVEMIYEVAGLANANADPGLIGFLTDSSTVRMNLKVELLLEGQLKNFSADQEINLDFGDFASETLFDSAEFKLVTENRMPLASHLQVYFRDANNVTLDSLFLDGAQDVIRSAPVNANTGLTTGETRTETYIPFSAARFENLRQNAKKAYLQTAFSTAEDGTVPVKILTTQGCTVKMGARVKRKF